MKQGTPVVKSQETRMILDGNAELYIKGLEIDWDKIGSDSYIRDIPSIAEVDNIDNNTLTYSHMQVCFVR